MGDFSQASPAGCAVHEESHPVSVLVADDDPAARGMIVLMLRWLGYRVTEADGAVEVLDVLRKSREHIDLLVTDVDMPGMSGIELCGTVRAECPGVRLLLISGQYHGVPGDIPFLMKPFTPAGLDAALKGALSSPPGAVR